MFAITITLESIAHIIFLGWLSYRLTKNDYYLLPEPTAPPIATMMLDDCEGFTRIKNNVP